MKIIHTHVEVDGCRSWSRSMHPSASRVTQLGWWDRRVNYPTSSPSNAYSLTPCASQITWINSDKSTPAVSQLSPRRPPPLFSLSTSGFCNRSIKTVINGVFWRFFDPTITSRGAPRWWFDVLSSSRPGCFSMTSQKTKEREKKNLPTRHIWCGGNSISPTLLLSRVCVFFCEVLKYW